MVELSDGGVCNAFVGATPGHKLLTRQLDRMTVYYQGAYKLHASYTPPAPPGYWLEHKNKLVGPATLRDAFAASGAGDAVYLFTESRLPFYKHRSWQRRLAAFLCGDCGVMTLDPGMSDDDFTRALDAAPLFYARNLGSRGCPPLYRIVLEHCLGWSVLAFVLALMSSHGRLWRERFDLMRARARGLAPVGSAAVADD